MVTSARDRARSRLDVLSGWAVKCCDLKGAFMCGTCGSTWMFAAEASRGRVLPATECRERDSLRAAMACGHPGDLRHVGDNASAVAKREGSKRDVGDRHVANILRLWVSGRTVQGCRARLRAYTLNAAFLDEVLAARLS